MININVQLKLISELSDADAGCGVAHARLYKDEGRQAGFKLGHQYKQTHRYGTIF
jgi:hypothetical protein